jgi:uracil-DNA glycosylase family 4
LPKAGIDKRAAQLAELHGRIHAACIQHDPELLPRKLVPHALTSDIFLVAQALAADTQRRSGLPYVDWRSGRLSAGGQELDRFLERFGYTIDSSLRGRRYAYASDLVHWYPGERASGLGDLVPEPAEIDRCWSWLEEEIRLVEPRVLIALGLPAAKELLSRYARWRVGPSRPRLRELTGKEHHVHVLGRRVPLFVVYHPSRAWQFPNEAPAAFEAAAKLIARHLTGSGDPLSDDAKR